MKILFVTPQVPWPATQGTTLRNYHLICAAATVHEVDLLSFGANAPVPAPLLSLCRQVRTVPFPARTPAHRVRDLMLGRADMERRLWSPEFEAVLLQMLRDHRYELVQMEGFEVAGYLLGPRALRRAAQSALPEPAIVFDDHNAEYELQASAAKIDAAQPRRWSRALYSIIQSRRIRRLEALYACAADLTLAVSPEDARALADIAPGVRPLVVSNGVDCAAMPSPAPAPEPVLFFAGKLDYRPNVDACEWLVRGILPLVQARVPGVRVVLAGRDPAPAVQRLAGNHVEVTGALSEEELARRRSQAWVYVVPMRMGSGVRFKVLEAMAAGVPLVATPLGVAGSGVQAGRHALIASEPRLFADAIVELIQDRSRREALVREARLLATEQHDWRHITPKLLAAYERLARDGAAPRPVSLITTVLNERASIERLLTSAAVQTRPPDEVVVVDGGSTDGTRALLDAWQQARFKDGERRRALISPGANISRGRNLAIAAATHEVIAATDAGVDLHPRWLEHLTGPLFADDETAAVAGFFVAAPEGTWERALGATTLPDVSEIDPGTFLPSSRSIAFRRHAWRAAGGYPEWLDYCEDLLFDFALIDQGLRPRFMPRAVVKFRPRSTPRAFFKQYYRYARGDGKADLWRKRHAIRYATYLGGTALLWQARHGGWRGRLSALLLLLGGVAYLKRPFQRLALQTQSLPQLLWTAPLIPLVRLIGDVAKMAGYPAGVLWRLRTPRK